MLTLCTAVGFLEPDWSTTGVGFDVSMGLPPPQVPTALLPHSAETFPLVPTDDFPLISCVVPVSTIPSPGDDPKDVSIRSFPGTLAWTIGAYLTSAPWSVNSEDSLPSTFCVTTCEANSRSSEPARTSLKLWRPFPQHLKPVALGSVRQGLGSSVRNAQGYGINSTLPSPPTVGGTDGAAQIGVHGQIQAWAPAQSHPSVLCRIDEATPQWQRLSHSHGAHLRYHHRWAWEQGCELQPVCVEFPCSSHATESGP